MVEEVAFASVSVQAWFSNDETSVQPGTTVGLTLTVYNGSDSEETLTIVPAGATAGWIRMETTLLVVDADAEASILVDVAPPPLPSTATGPTSVELRVVPSSSPDDDVLATLTVLVEPFDRRTITPLQPVQRARRRATYEFMVENHGNALASCRLLLHDPSGRVDGSFDPPAVGIAPGAGSLVQLKARARWELFRRSTRTLDFEIEAQQQGRESATADLSLVQPPTVSATAIERWLAVLAVIGVVVLAWFAVVRPAIDDAAERAVDELVTPTPAVTATAPSTSPTPTPATTSPDAEPPAEVTESSVPSGEPTFFRLSVNAPLTQTVDDTLPIPDGQLFDMTDVRIENPYNDRGLATLLVNGETIFIWSLQNIRGQYFEPRITQVRLQPGDNVTFAVRCDEISDAIRPTCTNAINIGGTAIAVDEV